MRNQELILDNLPLAKRIAFRFCKEHGIASSDWDDCLQEANWALSEAFQRWKPTRGPFENYAARFVKKSLANWRRRLLIVKHYEIVPLEWEVEEENAPTLDQTECSGLIRIVRLNLMLLDPIEKLVVSHYYGIDKEPISDAKIGILVRKTKQRVNEIRRAALYKLRAISIAA